MRLTRGSLRDPAVCKRTFPVGLSYLRGIPPVSLPVPPRSAAWQCPVPSPLLISVSLLLGCRHGQAPAPDPSSALVRIAILQDGVGALEVDPAAGTARLVSANI